jgi:lysophospholipase L1-like esterase
MNGRPAVEMKLGKPTEALLLPGASAGCNPRETRRCSVLRRVVAHVRSAGPPDRRFDCAPAGTAAAAGPARSSRKRLPRVMLIGDSISIGYTPFVRKQLCGVVEVHRPPENCGSSGQGVAALNTWFDAAAQGAERWDCVHWNFGIHDIKCPQRDGQNATPLEVYKENLREILRRLRPLAKQIIWCSTTLSPESASGAPPEDFTRYNEVARSIMEEAGGVRVNDLWAFSLPRLAALQLPDNSHFSPEGSRTLATQVVAAIKQALTAAPIV